VHGVDCEALGSLYASALVVNPATALPDIPALQKHSAYAALKGQEKSAVRTNIKEIARKMLLEAGYNPVTVAEVLSGK
jgi:hypothetical protein